MTTFDRSTHWVIMDKKRKVIGMGVPRDRRLQFVGSKEGSGRILTYNSKKKAESGFKVSGFYDGEGVKDYLMKTYPEAYKTVKASTWKYAEDLTLFLEAVEIEITLKEKINA